jgi:hypothetical protein
MHTFFADIDSLDRFTHGLDSHTDTLQCRHCQQRGQLVSHGFVYKKQHGGEPLPVGKRIFCSNRCGRSGCGRTRRLYLAAVIPAWHYAASCLTGFVSGLCAGVSIAAAYCAATGAASHRQAYRWLHKLDCRLSVYRCLTPRHERPLTMGRCRRLALLLPALATLFEHLGPQPCARFQFQQQATFA